MKEPRSRNIWITGASSGIGRALAFAFAEAGDLIAISARNREMLQEMEERINAGGGTCLSFPCDVRDDKNVTDVSKRIEAHLGPVDVLINNAGVTVFKSFIDSTVDDYERILDTNLRGAFLCTKAVLPSMIRRREGLVIMINSVTTKYEFTNSSIYASSKAGLKAMTDVLRKELRESGIRLLSVYPGATDTEIWKSDIREKHADQMLKPMDVANIILELSRQPKHVMVEEILLRPIGGDL